MPSLPLQAGHVPLKEHDPELWGIIEKERVRQVSSLELIASEVRSQIVNSVELRVGDRPHPFRRV
jgi:glycine/serine hydroxymethyltransferase